MSQVRRWRLEQLEQLARLRQPTPPYVDPFEVAKALFDILQHDAPAVRAEWIPVPEPERSEEAQAAFDQTM